MLGVTTTMYSTLLAPALADDGTGGSVLTMHVHVSQTNFNNLHRSSASWCLHGLETEMYRKLRSNQEPTDATVDILSGYLRGQVS